MKSEQERSTPPSASPRTDQAMAEYRLETSLSGGRDQAYREAARERWLEHIWPDEHRQLELEQSVLRAELLQSRARYETAVEHLTRIYGLLNPPDVQAHGTSYRFNNPNANDTLQALSDAIRAIPEEVRCARSENAPIVPTKEMIEAGRLAIMGMLEPKRAVMPKPSIAELEAILNADGDGRNINIEPDGSVTELTPRTTTASEVAKTAYEAMVAEATK